ncbi:GAP family protein [Nocardia sp. NPDC058480]|uniref:GAP family protein n=1 Tax=unclassified Nocardia TaxID=2637762 RepID=UPI0036621064
MVSALGETLTYAIGLALSPFAVTTGIVFLLGDRGRTKAALFGLGWFAALAVITTVAMLVVDSVDDDYPEQTADGIDIIALVFAALFFALAVVAWMKRPSSTTAEASKSASGKGGLLDRLDGFSLVGAVGLGLAQGFLVVKNIPLGVSAGAALGSAGLNTAESAVAVAIFAFLATLGVVVPLAAAVLGGQRINPALAQARAWIDTNMTAITITVLLILGAYFLGQGLRLTA